MIRETIENDLDCKHFQMERAGSLTKMPQEKDALLPTTWPSQKYIWNKHKLTGTPPEIILQSSTRTTYDKEDT